MSNEDPHRPYLLLARSLVDGRTARGMSQGDLARVLEVRQQSVSRWEGGTHRPAAGQIDALAKALVLNGSDLRKLAGYEAAAGVSLVRPIPVDRLDAETFEQFSADFVQTLSPELSVRRVGGTGHDQDGVDVEGFDASGHRIFAVQCKRVSQFGPAQADAVIKAFKGQADTKVLMLSRVASPQSAARLRSAGWELWDKDDINRRFRNLPPVKQDALVETYFRGQNLELLGRVGPGPWMETDRFFRPFHQQDALFSHDWPVHGRDAELDALRQRIENPAQTLTVLNAAGGMGKSRLLLEAARDLNARQPELRIHFLSTTAELTRQDLATLGAGPKVVVVDDAHDRDALGVLFEYAADAQNQTRLVLATRPYARQRLMREASVFGLFPAEVKLEALKSSALEELARHMLAARDEPTAWADQMVAVSGGSPLLMSMAVRSLAREPMAAEQIRNQDEFRHFVLGKFRKVVEGRLGASDSADAQIKVLEVLALAQPFHPEDKQLVELITKVQDVPTADVERILGSLVAGGVALRRGAQHRLMPDVLGDYLIDESCLAGDRLSHFANRVLEEAPSRLLVNAVINLGRLDWRRTDGDTAGSRLLEDVWRSFETIDQAYDERLAAIKTVSVFQPYQALRFVAHLVKRNFALDVVPEILRNIAYSTDYLRQALNLLWEMARNDERETGPHPNHPMRVLADMVSYKDGKPADLVEAMFEFALEQADRVDMWDGHATPINLLEPFLATEGFEDRATGRTIHFSPYQLRYDFVRPFRERVVKKLFDLIRRPEPRVSRLAALAFQSVLRGPTGMMGSAPSPELLMAYDQEIIETLSRLKDALDDGLEPIPALGVLASAAWHADHGEATRDAAQALLACLPDTVEFRTLAALSDGYGNLYLHRNASRRWSDDVEEQMGRTVDELTAILPDPGARLDYIETCMRALTAAGDKLNSSHVLLQALLWADRQFARVLLDRGEQDPNAPSAIMLASAAHAVWNDAPVEGRTVIRRWLDGAVETLRRSAPLVLVDRFENLAEDDIDLVRAMLVDRDPVVVCNTLRSIWTWRAPDEVVLDLIFSATLRGELELEQVAMILGGRTGELLTRVTEEQAAGLMKVAEPFPRLDGHWLNEAIAAFSGRFPRATAAFFRARVEYAVPDPFEFRVANYGPYARSRLEFARSDVGVEILSETWDWLRLNWSRGFGFQHPATHLFDAMFLGDAEHLIDFFEPQMDTAGPLELELLSALLREVHFKFVLRRTDFVIRYLERCAQFDRDLVDQVSQRLYAAATSGMYSGMPGEPMPRDLETRDLAKAILDRLSPMSPAWELYDWICDHADRNIERARREGELMDD